MPDPLPADPSLKSGSTSPPTVSVPDARPASPAADSPPFRSPTHPGDLGRLGKYRVLKELGRGGMGAVFLGYDEGLRRRVALKVMLPRFAARPDSKERFLREARAAAAVHSDYVVTIFDVGEDNGIPYIAMEYLQGTPLDQHLKGGGAPSVAQVVRIGRETALGLAAAHEQGMIHRDIKPANLWLETPNGRAKILDFGLARVEEEVANQTEVLPEAAPSGDGTEQLTRTGAVLGTPAYMSPEQARGKKVDGRSDLFSLGGVLYRLLTGRLPFPGQNQTEVLLKLATEDPIPVRDLNPAVPEAVAALVHRLLARDPDGRPATAGAVAAELGALAGAAGPEVVYVPLAVEAQPESVWEQLDEPPTHVEEAAPGPKPMPRPRWPVAVLTGVLGVLVVAAAVWLGVKALRKDPEPAPPDEPPPAPREELPPGPVEPPPGPADDRLFPGPGLAGWKGDGDVWKLEKGVLVGTNRTASTQHLISDRRVRDFELAFQVMVGGDRPSWMLRFRSVLAKTSGVLSEPVSLHAGGGGFALFGVQGKGRGATVKAQPRTFNEVLVRVVGKRVTVTVNGTPVVADEAFDMPAEGALAFSLGAGASASVKVTRFTELNLADLPFFNGRDLTGWTAQDATWRVEDGILIGTRGNADPAKYGRLASDRVYRDFELTFDARLPVGETASLRFRKVDRLDTGIALAGAAGTTFALDKGKYTELAAPSAEAKDAFRPGQFNAFRLRAEGKRVAVWVNGKLANEGTYPSVLPAGQFFWLIDPNSTELRVKNVRLTDLTRFPPDPTFFSGKDLAGWEALGTDAAAWRVEDGALVCKKAGNGKYARLVSRKAYTDFELSFELRGSAEPPNFPNLRFRYADEDRLSNGGPTLAFRPDPGIDLMRVKAGPTTPAPFRAGEFNTVTVRAVGKRLTVTANGVTVADGESDLPPAGVFAWGLPHVAGEMTVRNVRLTDLSKPADPDRRAAEALGPHATLALKLESGATATVKPGDPLPAEPFALTAIQFPPAAKLPGEFVSGTLLPVVEPLLSLRTIYDPSYGVTWTEGEVVRLANSPAAANLAEFRTRFTWTLKAIDALKRVPNLTFVSGHADQADDALLARLKELPGMTRLGLAWLGKDRPVGEAGWTAVAALPLRTLYLDRAAVDARVARLLAGMPKLDDLSLWGCPVGADVAAELARSSSLTRLDLVKSTVTDAGLEPLAGLKTLRLVTLGATAVTKDGVEKLAAARPDLKIEWDGGTVEPAKKP